MTPIFLAVGVGGDVIAKDINGKGRIEAFAMTPMTKNSVLSGFSFQLVVVHPVLD